MAASRKKSSPKASPPSKISHLFQVQLIDTRLTQAQVERIAATIRAATTKELLKLDFKIDELQPLFRKGFTGSPCGSGCMA